MTEEPSDKPPADHFEAVNIGGTGNTQETKQQAESEKYKNDLKLLRTLEKALLIMVGEGAGPQGERYAQARQQYVERVCSTNQAFAKARSEGGDNFLLNFARRMFKSFEAKVNALEEGREEKTGEQAGHLIIETRPVRENAVPDEMKEDYKAVEKEISSAKTFLSVLTETRRKLGDEEIFPLEEAAYLIELVRVFNSEHGTRFSAPQSLPELIGLMTEIQETVTSLQTERAKFFEKADEDFLIREDE